MKLRIWHLTVLVMLLGSLIFTACGPAATPTEEATAEPVAEETTDATEEPEATEEPADVDLSPDDTLTVAGTMQQQLGCEENWAADCDATTLTYDEASGTWGGTFEIEPGAYEFSITLNGSWDVSFGVDGKSGMGTNYTLSMAEAAPVTFTFDPETKTTTVESEGIGDAPVVEYDAAHVAGTLQTQLDCDEDWSPDCDATALTYDEASGLWVGTFDLAAGSYEYKVTVNGSWDVSFPEGMEGNKTLTLAEDAPVTISFDPLTNEIMAESEGLAAPPAASVEGGLVIWADENRAKPLRELAEAFKAEYGIDIVVEELGMGDVRDIFTVAAPAGEGPDIIVGAHDWLGELAASGLLAPLDLGDKAADFSPAALEAFTYQGELYGMPNAVENVAFFRNTDLVPDAPETWDEVTDISRDLAADNDEDLETNRYGFVRMESNPYHFFPIQTAFGGYVFGQHEDGSWNPEDVGMDNEGSIAAAQWYADMIEEGLQPPAVEGETMVAWFEQGKSAMTITGPWNLSRIRDSGVNYALSNIPAQTQDGQPFLGVQGFMVNAFSKEPLLAQVFLTEFVATTETMQAIYDMEPRPPAYLPLLETLDDPDLVAFAEAGANGVPMPAIPEMGAVWEAWTNALTLVAQGGDTPESAFTNAADQIRDAIAESE
jgi:maltose/maltodextrin transport system substrate-binding protein/arabinogalactan oligomer/maltooligosaccharide transport system substrate-binding protein